LNPAVKTKEALPSLRDLPNGTLARITRMPEKDGCAERACYPYAGRKADCRRVEDFLFHPGNTFKILPRGK